MWHRILILKTTKIDFKGDTMKEITKHDLLLKAYDLLSDVTPKKYDCGILCGAACCAENKSHGEEDECGMLLLPGEKELLEGEAGFVFNESENGTLLVCGGGCLRDLRPFACRIFPFYPKLEQNGKRISIEILPDPRSKRICPIFNDFRRRKTHIEFIRCAKRAVRTLLRDEDIKKELLSQSEMISDIEKLRLALMKGLE